MGQVVIFEEEQKDLLSVCERLVRDALAKAIFIVDRDGQLIAETGETSGLDTTGLASLVAGSTAATGGLALMLDEDEFTMHTHQGTNASLHISPIGETMILLVIFDERSSQGLVGLRVKRAHITLEDILVRVKSRNENEGDQAMDIFGEITDDDIDSLFNDAF